MLGCHRALLNYIIVGIISHDYDKLGAVRVVRNGSSLSEMSRSGEETKLVMEGVDKTGGDNILTAGGSGCSGSVVPGGGATW